MTMSLCDSSIAGERWAACAPPALERTRVATLKAAEARFAASAAKERVAELKLALAEATTVLDTASAGGGEKEVATAEKGVKKAAAALDKAEAEATKKAERALFFLGLRSNFHD